MTNTDTRPHVALQMSPHCFYDEGIEHVLDTLQRLAGVQEVFVYSQTLHGHWGKEAPASLPDHGVPRAKEPRANTAQVWHRTHAEYYRGLPIALEQDPSRLYGDKDVFDDLKEPVERRGMKVSAFILEPGWGLPLVNWSRVSVVDSEGRRRNQPCPRNPDYRAWWNAGLEDLLHHHPFVAGLLFGQERGTPLSLHLNHVINREHYPACFCEHCVEAGHREGIRVDRARRGMKDLHEYAMGLREGGERPADGAFVTLLRLFIEYPEVLAWDRMFREALESQRRELYGIAHAVGGAPKRVGWHVEANNGFDPFRRAQNDLSRYRTFSDFVKLVAYSNPNGFRARRQFWHPSMFKTWLSDVPDEVAVPLIYHLMGYDPSKEPGAETLRREEGHPGFSDDYVYRETLRGVRTAAPVPLYAGVGLDIRPGAPTTLESAYRDTMAALRAGAKGILISRDYTEMQLTSLEGVGRAVRDWCG